MKSWVISCLSAQNLMEKLWFQKDSITWQGRSKELHTNGQILSPSSKIINLIENSFALGVKYGIYEPWKEERWNLKDFHPERDCRDEWKNQRTDMCTWMVSYHTGEGIVVFRCGWFGGSLRWIGFGWWRSNKRDGVMRELDEDDRSWFLWWVDKVS